MKRWALITGASQGIGLEFARLFAREGYDLVLVARDKPRLETISRELQAQFKVAVRLLPKDLSVPGAAEEIFKELQGENIFIHSLINNAGFGFQGSFAKLDLARHRALMVEGVQFHPESVLTADGPRVLANFVASIS